MNKKDLLSIGELSKITGVHIKALRYYDSIGILTPTYVDPDSGYRYYSFYQKATVNAIQFCVELNIPLKQFPEYTNEAAPWISYADLIQHGEKLIEEKIRTMQERLVRLEDMRTEIARAENSCQSTIPKKYMLPARDCWIVPYDGKLLCGESSRLTKKVILEIHRSGLHLGNADGLLLMRQGDEWKKFLFVDIQTPTEEMAKCPEIIHIPESTYFCKVVDHSDIEQAWDWSLPFVKKEQIQLVIETELFVGNYRFSAPTLEQRCLFQ